MLIAYCELWCGAGVVSSSDGEGVGRGPWLIVYCLRGQTDSPSVRIQTESGRISCVGDQKVKLNCWLNFFSNWEYCAACIYVTWPCVCKYGVSLNVELRYKDADYVCSLLTPHVAALALHALEALHTHTLASFPGFLLPVVCSIPKSDQTFYVWPPTHMYVQCTSIRTSLIQNFSPMLSVINACTQELWLAKSMWLLQQSHQSSP